MARSAESSPEKHEVAELGVPVPRQEVICVQIATDERSFVADGAGIPVALVDFALPLLVLGREKVIAAVIDEGDSALPIPVVRPALAAVSEFGNSFG
jgi:hypothetical protein